LEDLEIPILQSAQTDTSTTTFSNICPRFVQIGQLLTTYGPPLVAFTREAEVWATKLRELKIKYPAYYATIIGRILKESYSLIDIKFNEECTRVGDRWMKELEKIEKTNKQRWACIVQRLHDLWMSAT
jgi:hypothetical protein